MIHRVKSWPGWFDAVVSGAKLFELRNNDRDYQVDDTLVLQEWHPDQKQYTGREVRLRITYVLHGTDNGWTDGGVPRRGLRTGYAILGLRGEGAP